jgi:uncharacterized protein (DUF1697 family)
MPELKKCFEEAGFTDVKTVLSSGNVVFSAGGGSDTSLERKAQAAMERRLGRTFLTVVRRVGALREIIDSDPYRDFHLPARAKRVVAFLRKRSNAKLTLPIELDGAQILCSKGREIFTA